MSNIFYNFHKDSMTYYWLVFHSLDEIIVLKIESDVVKIFVCLLKSRSESVDACSSLLFHAQIRLLSAR